VSDPVVQPGPVPAAAVRAAAEAIWRAWSDVRSDWTDWEDCTDEVREYFTGLAAAALEAARHDETCCLADDETEPADDCPGTEGVRLAQAHADGYGLGHKDGSKDERARILAIAEGEHAVVPCHDPETGAHVGYAPFGMVVAEHDADLLDGPPETEGT
jgi:hypothetical protein